MDSRPTSRPALAALIGLEWRRVRTHSVRIVGGSAVLLPALWFSGIVDEGLMPFLLYMVTLSLAFACPLQVIKDKLDGSMEFLTALPVPASTHALARLIACSGMAAVGAVFSALACAMALPQLLGTSSLRIFLFSYPVVLLLSASFAWVTTAVLARFKLAQLGAAAVIVPFLAGVGALWVVDALFGDPLQLLVQAVASPVGRWILALSGIAVCFAALAASFALTTAAMRNYRPERDAIDW